MKNPMLWDVTRCSPVEFRLHFRGTYHLHILGPRTIQISNQQERGVTQSALRAACNTFLRNVGDIVPDYNVSHPGI
jgi:hypothetical protein